jgi:hypothetical protein
MDQHDRDVRFVPKADILRCSKTASFSHLVSELLHRKWNRQPKRFGGLDVDDPKPTINARRPANA